MDFPFILVESPATDERPYYPYFNSPFLGSSYGHLSPTPSPQNSTFGDSSPSPSTCSFESLDSGTFHHAQAPYTGTPINSSLSRKQPSSFAPHFPVGDYTGIPDDHAIGESVSAPSSTPPISFQELCRLFVTKEPVSDPLSHPDRILSYIQSNSKDIVLTKTLTEIIFEHGLSPVVGTTAVKGASAARRKRDTKFFCRVCAADLTTKGNAQYHVMAHFHLKFQLCDLCGASFGTSLKRHQKTCKQHPRIYSNRRKVQPSPNIITSNDVAPFPSIHACAQDSMSDYLSFSS